MRVEFGSGSAGVTIGSCSETERLLFQCCARSDVTKADFEPGNSLVTAQGATYNLGKRYRYDSLGIW